MIARAASLLTVIIAALVASLSPAAANVRIPDDGQEPGQGLSTLVALGLFAGIPLLVIGLVTALVYLPGMRSPKTPYEPTTDVATRP